MNFCSVKLFNLTFGRRRILALRLSFGLDKRLIQKVKWTNQFAVYITVLLIVNHYL